MDCFYGPHSLQVLASMVIRKKLKASLSNNFNWEPCTNKKGQRVFYWYHFLTPKRLFVRGRTFIDVKEFTTISHRHFIHDKELGIKSIKYGFTFSIDCLPKITAIELDSFTKTAIHDWDSWIEYYNKRRKKLQQKSQSTLKSMAIAVIRRQLFLVTFVNHAHCIKYYIIDYQDKSIALQSKKINLRSMSDIDVEQEALDIIRSMGRSYWCRHAV